MKMVLLMYLEEDEKCVNQLLQRQGVPTFSRLPVEGHGPGSAAGWSGEVQPYSSQMTLAILQDEPAQAFVEAVAGCTGVEDPRHPIRAALIDVERFTCCEREPQP